MPPTDIAPYRLVVLTTLRDVKESVVRNHPCRQVASRYGDAGAASFNSPVQSLSDSANRDCGHFPSDEHSGAKAVLAAG